MARPEIIKTELGQRLRLVRERTGNLPRDEFAQHLGISSKTLANYERGDTQPDADALAAYRRVARADTNWLVTGDGQMFETAADTIAKQTAADLAGPPIPKVSALETLRVLAPRRDETGPDQARLAAAIEAVEEGLAGRHVAPAVKAELTIAAYHLLAVATEDSRAQVIRLVKGA